MKINQKVSKICYATSMRDRKSLQEKIFVVSLNELNRSSSSRAFPDKNKDEWTDKWNICHSNSEITVAEENILRSMYFQEKDGITYDSCLRKSTIRKLRYLDKKYRVVCNNFRIR
uniref:Uncharacterized protein n=1 Tax=Onchocerca volvulus TaxID=6282 RepID=A0A8R1TLT0_ONCVO